MCAFSTQSRDAKDRNEIRVVYHAAAPSALSVYAGSNPPGRVVAISDFRAADRPNPPWPFKNRPDRCQSQSRRLMDRLPFGLCWFMTRRLYSAPLGFAAGTRPWHFCNSQHSSYSTCRICIRAKVIIYSLSLTSHILRCISNSSSKLSAVLLST